MGGASSQEDVVDAVEVGYWDYVTGEILRGIHKEVNGAFRRTLRKLERLNDE